MLKVSIGILSASIFLAACANPADNKAKAVTAEANSTAATTRQIKGESVAITPENSKVEFVGSKVTGKHDGGFKQFSGNIDLVNNKAEASQVAIDIDMNSVFTDADGLTKHLQTGDFFEVEKHPKSSFVSTKIVPDATKGADNYTVTGDLEMHGQKKSVTFPAKITVNPNEVTVDAEFAINRKDFGIVYAGKADDLIRDDVVIKLNLKSQRSK
ncbi:MAG: YceI family protein [Acidobacteriota bacterium]|nr:YceI family protein [Acidobacteriota bacterium]